jgi:TRAP-type C4-dicarboxylate transport system permease large subunit
MKSSGVDKTIPEASGASVTKRRGLLLGAGVAGAAALAARALPVGTAEVAAAPAAKAPADKKAGYQLTQHVLRYYETTKV